MKVLRKLGLFAIIPAIVILMMFSGAAAQPPWDHFPTATDADTNDALEETRPSLGGFKLYVMPIQRHLFTNMIGYDSGSGRLTSPTVMSDDSTMIGMSVVHLDDDTDDADCPVGVGANRVIIGDGSFISVPGGYDNDGYEEVHTNVIDMELTDGFGNFVRAGMAQGLGISPGEVQSNAGAGLPGKSFFDVKVEVELQDQQNNWGGGAMFFYNQKPMFVEADPVNSLPPKVVYIHQGSYATAVYFKQDNLPYWSADKLLGYMELAGHGMGFDSTEAEVFWGILDQPEHYREIPVIPTLSEWGIIIFLLVVLSLITVVVTRRRMAMAGAGGAVDTSSAVGGTWFVPAIYVKALAVTLTLAGIGLVAAFAASGSLALRDVIGTLLSAAIVAYMAHVWICRNRE